MPPTPVADLTARLAALAALPGVGPRSIAAREACTALRFNEALRRRIPEAAAESRIRGAQASAALEGADVPLERVRELVLGIRPWPDDPDPVEQVLRGVIQATAETEHVMALVLTAPLQALARLHVAAMAGLLPADQVGRPRRGEETSREFVDLGPAAPPAQVAERLTDLAAVLTSRADQPAVVVAGLVHAEIAVIRPFVRGNGAVARAMERCIIQASGLDPTGVAVPEAGHGRGGGPAYLGALTAYAVGGREGVALWLQHCADAVVTGAAEGERICAAVRAGRLD